MNFFKKTWAEISIDAIEHNFKQIRKVLRPETAIMAVVKADAYGHGAVPLAHIYQRMGVNYFAVSSIDEAIQLREGGVESPILILGWTPAEYTPDLQKYHITQTVFSLKQVQEMQKYLKTDGEKVKVHLKIDSGMSRLGFFCEGKSIDDIQKIAETEGLFIEGIFTHFAVSDDPEDSFTYEQFNRFQEMISLCEQRGIHFKYRHCCNSGAILDYPEMQLDMVRPGIILYGLVPDQKSKPFDLIPAMTLKTCVSQCREFPSGTTVSYGRTYTCSKPQRIGVVSIGYADGLMRSFSDKIDFYFNGKRIHQIGRICMDMCMADISDVDIHTGDIVEVFGVHQTATELAEKIDTISYELICQISKRVPRIYLKNGVEIAGLSYLHQNQA